MRQHWDVMEPVPQLQVRRMIPNLENVVGIDGSVQNYAPVDGVHGGQLPGQGDLDHDREVE